MNKLRNILPAFICLAVLAASAQDKKERWLDPNVNRVNAEPSRANFFAYESQKLAQGNDKTASKLYLSAEGKWKFHFVKDHDKRPLDFIKPTLTIRSGRISTCRQFSKSTVTAMPHIRI